MKFIDHPILVVVWGQEGCPACKEYIPKFRNVAAHYARCIPSVVVDAEKFENAANHYRVRSTPTTMISRYGRRSLRSIEGDVSEDEINKLFQYAITGMDCKL